MASINPNPLVLNSLRDLSYVIARSQDRGGRDFSGVVPSAGQSHALGGIDMAIAMQGQAAPAPVRYGAITVNARSTIDAIAHAHGVHVAVQRAFNNPGIRFGDRSNSAERPEAEAGTVSCHFSQTSVSNTSPIIDMIKTARTGRRLTSSRAAAHELYIERDGAAEKAEKSVDERQHDRCSEKKILDELEQEALSRSPEAQQEYLDQLVVAERVGGNLTDADLDALDEASFGTIGASTAERKRFWVAVEQSERQPRGDTIVIRAQEHPGWWAKAVDSLEQAPAEIRKQIAKRVAKGGPGELTVKVPTTTAFKIHQWAVNLDPNAPIEIEPGRGGRTQTRIIAELPHELDPRERLEIVRDFADKLTEKGFPYWAVIHAPDANNDERNFHVHIVYYDRPTAKMPHPKTGEISWDFEILEEKKYTSRNRREVRPYRKKKTREANATDWLDILRAHWEKVANVALEKAGVAKRYHLGSNASVGIAIEPMHHIKPKTFNKERTGELTADGVVLARRQWKVMLDRILMGHAKRLAKRLDKVGRLEKRLTAKVRNPKAREHIEAQVAEARKRAQTFGICEVYLDITKWCVDRIVSRSKLMLHADENRTTGQKPLGNRKELLAYVDLIYQRGLVLNRENGLRVDLAARRYSWATERLTAMIDPRRGQARLAWVESPSVEDDPAWKEKAIQRVSERMEAMAKDMLPKIMADIERDEARASGPQPDGLTGSPLTTEPSGPGARAGVADPTARAPEGADASRVPDSHGPPATMASSARSEPAIAVKAETKPAFQATPAPAAPHRVALQRTLFKSDQQIAAEHAERERAKAQAADAQPAAPRPDTAKPEQAAVKATHETSRISPPASPSVGPAAALAPAAMPPRDLHAPAPRAAGGTSSMRPERQPEEGRQAPASQMAGAATHQPAVPRQAGAELQSHRDRLAVERREPSDVRKREITSDPERNANAKPQAQVQAPMPEARRPQVQRPQSTVAATSMPERLASPPVSLGRKAASAPVHPTPDPAIPAAQETGITRVIKPFGFPGQEPREDKLKPVPQPDALTGMPARDVQRRSKKRNKKHSDGHEIER